MNQAFEKWSKDKDVLRSTSLGAPAILRGRSNRLAEVGSVAAVSVRTAAGQIMHVDGSTDIEDVAQ